MTEIASPTVQPPIQLPSHVFTRIFTLFLRDQQLETLATCMRVSRQLYKTAGSLLYRNLELGATFQYPPTQKRHYSDPNPLLDVSLTPSRMMTANGKRKPRPKLKVDLLIYTQKLIVRPHPERLCALLNGTGLKNTLTSLHTLRFDPRDARTTCHAFESDNGNSCGFAKFIFSQPHIPTLELLVFKGITCHNPLPIAPFSARNVTIALVPWQYSERDSLDLNTHTFQETERVVLIFWSTSAGELWYSAGGRVHRIQRSPRNNSVLTEPGIEMLIADSACSSSASIKEILVVGAGNIVQKGVAFSCKWHERVVQKEIERKVRDAVTRTFAEREEKGRMDDVLGKMRFCSVETYLKDEDWNGAFDEKEVLPWLD